MDNIFQTFTLQTLNNISDTQWLIEDIIPNESLIILYGPSGCGKTFIALDISLHIAHNKPWKKQAIIKPGIIIYCIGEGVHGISNRIKAWHDYNNCLLDAPFVLLPIEAISFSEPDNISKMITTLEQIREEYDLPISMIIIDTLSKASVGYDENSSKDMGQFLYNFDIIKKYFSTSIMFVHHSGKNSSRGMRGSSYLLGTVDTAIQVDNMSETLIVQIEKQKDGIEGSFQLKLKKHLDSLVVFDNNINLKFRSKTGYILDKKVNEIDITKIIELLKKSDSLDKISKTYNIEISKLKKIIQKDLLKENQDDIDSIISKYGFENDKDKEWIKSINL